MTATQVIRALGGYKGLTRVAYDDGVATFAHSFRGTAMAFSVAPCGNGVLVAGMSRTLFRALPESGRRWMADMNSRADVTVGPRQGHDGRWRCFAACYFENLRGVSVDTILARSVECAMVVARFDEFAAQHEYA